MPRPRKAVQCLVTCWRALTYRVQTIDLPISHRLLWNMSHSEVLPQPKRLVRLCMLTHLHCRISPQLKMSWDNVLDVFPSSSAPSFINRCKLCFQCSSSSGASKTQSLVWMRKMSSIRLKSMWDVEITASLFTWSLNKVIQFWRTKPFIRIYHCDTRRVVSIWKYQRKKLYFSLFVVLVQSVSIPSINKMFNNFSSSLKVSWKKVVSPTDQLLLPCLAFTEGSDFTLLFQPLLKSNCLL